MIPITDTQQHLIEPRLAGSRGLTFDLCILVSGESEASQRRLFHENAARLYRLPA